MNQYYSLELLLAQVVDFDLKLDVLAIDQKVLHGNSEGYALVADGNIEGHVIYLLYSFECEL
jgi:hypothetical protein